MNDKADDPKWNIAVERSVNSARFDLPPATYFFDAQCLLQVSIVVFGMRVMSCPEFLLSDETNGRATQIVFFDQK